MDRTAIVTGANTGIGRITALAVAKAGYRVYLACRSKDRTEEALREIQAATSRDQVSFLPLDLADLESVRRSARTFLEESRPLHLLINNAGIAGQRGVTKDGYELAFGINHLGHFAFTQTLLPALKNAGGARVVNVSSRAHYRAKGIDWDAVRSPTKHLISMPEYSVSKLANVLHASEMARRHADDKIHTYSLHPGVVATEIWRRLPRAVQFFFPWFMISPEDGAKTSIHCALSESVAGDTGLYYDKEAPRTPSRLAQDQGLAQELWTFSEEATQVS